MLDTHGGFRFKIEREGFPAVFAIDTVVDIKGLPPACKSLAAQRHRAGKFSLSLFFAWLYNRFICCKGMKIFLK